MKMPKINISELLKLLILLVVMTTCASRAQGFDFGLTWDNPPATNLVDIFTTNTTSWATITGFNVYRGTTPTNIVLLSTNAYVTNIVRLTNQPTTEAYYYVTFTGPGGESIPSNTNHVYPPLPPPLIQNVKGKR